MSLTAFTQINFVADFFREKCNFRRKTAVLRFIINRNYTTTRDNDAVHHWKAHGGLSIVIIEFFSLGVRLRRYEQKSIENRRFRRIGASLA